MLQAELLSNLELIKIICEFNIFSFQKPLLVILITRVVAEVITDAVPGVYPSYPPGNASVSPSESFPNVDVIARSHQRAH